MADGREQPPGRKAAALPADTVAAEEEDGGAPALELQHVRHVYDHIAPKWHGTRYKPWPRVEAFARAARPGSLICEVGAGNGKNLAACGLTGPEGARGFSMAIASDTSLPLARIARSLGHEVHTADVAALPYRTGVFDAVLCVAVLHHLATPRRREAACAECCRVLRPGGRALFYAWAQEQERGADAGVSGHRFPAQDVLVPFHVPTGALQSGAPAAAAAPGAAPELPAGATLDEGKGAVVFQRYCHVYCDGELEALLAPLVTAGVAVVDATWYDRGNWCLVARRL